jgi:ABC-type sugar transport system substrate-binding protein
MIVAVAAAILVLGAAPKRETHVLLLLKTLDNPFFVDIQRGVTEGLKQIQGPPVLHVRAGTQEGDVAAQRQILETYLNRYATSRPARLEAVVLTPASSGDELTALIRDVRNRGVKLILLDTRIDAKALQRASTTYDMFAGSSNRAGGQLAADLIAARVPAKARILLINGVQGHETAAERRAGFSENIKKKVRGVEIIERTGNWRRTEGRSIVDGFITMGGRFDAIFAANDEMALGAAQAVRQIPAARRPIVVGFDATAEARRAVAAGELFATIAQDPYGMGRSAAEAVARYRSGKPVARDQVVAVKAITR